MWKIVNFVRTSLFEFNRDRQRISAKLFETFTSHNSLRGSAQRKEGLKSYFRSQTISASFIKSKNAQLKKIHFGKSNKRNTVYSNIHKKSNSGTITIDEA